MTCSGGEKTGSSDRPSRRSLTRSSQSTGSEQGQYGVDTGGEYRGQTGISMMIMMVMVIVMVKMTIGGGILFWRCPSVHPSVAISWKCFGGFH
ncbi:hypothetical protein DPMN_178091 [Dreissena polymorpha]|uniref:Uncharacterized protein n=1 Tax=Dreissena polymorpha TaxID=45954 RepID=A0A9D4IJJ8_DREPO|nr:hypothetical protein DPMN_178091 [Dreissena polymorpha]